MFFLPKRGFGGIPVRDSAERLDGVKVALLGVASSAGAPHDGAENGPRFLRAASRRHTWGYPDGVAVHWERRDTGIHAVDLGDLRPQGVAEEVAHEVAGAVAAIDPRCVPCVIGGDHSITAGVIDGLIARGTPPARVIQLDHHLDLQLWSASEDEIPDPLFHTNVMTHIGARLGARSILQLGVDPFASVSASMLPELDQRLRPSAGIIPITSQTLGDPSALRVVLAGDAPTYLTVDVDVIVDSQMRSTGYPAPIGLDTADLIRIVELVIETNPIVGVDIVEFGASADMRDEIVMSDATRASDIVMSVLSQLSI